MSKKSDCYGNVAMESWKHNLRIEAIHGERFAARQQAKVHVFHAWVYYNRRLLNLTLDNVSPVEFALG